MPTKRPKIQVHLTTTRAGVPGYAMRAWNQHSQSWQWCGVVYTGKDAYRLCCEDREQYVRQLTEEQAA